MSFIKSKHSGWLSDGTRTPFTGGGGGGGPSNTTTQTSNIPDWLRPQVEAAIGASTQELFNTKNVGATPDVTKQIGTDENGQPIMETTRGTPGTQEITGIKGYTPYSTKGSDYVAGFGGMQNQAMQSVQGLKVPGQYGEATGMASQAGQGLLGSVNPAYGYGSLGAQYGGQGANIGQGGLGYGAMGANVGAQAAQAGNQYNAMATNPGATQAFMSPYIQNALSPQLAEMQRQYAISGNQAAGNAARSGAFGGSRASLEQAENRRNMNMGMNQAIGQGYQNAFQAAQQAQQFGSTLGLQGQQTAIQGANTGISGINAALTGNAQGMQGAQIGLQGVGAAQAGYSGAGTQATNLANIGKEQLASQQSIANQQMQMGGQEQALRQQAINQDIQNFANKTVYPQQQLAFYNSMIRGYATPTQTTASYQAAPSAASQIAGLGLTGAAAYGLAKKKGGVIKAKKKKKSDGVDTLGLYNVMSKG
jgi:hypothetical protein